ncbi:hypothetical protein C5468_00305 [Photorhabdus luminescens subsp. mexicana]|uniref:Uncharacterized protein n=1 Tax=Photorhabdus luminescens subsp. mexicana TaxID=2100167 RepID=A0A4R4JP63_PHOLU|nr:hypothetical protein C5468_00305 [Photorhabdus luminescens subsp. mexicana]
MDSTFTYQSVFRTGDLSLSVRIMGVYFVKTVSYAIFPERCRLGIRVQMFKDSVWNIKRRKSHEKIEGIREK